jgi:predicted MFS family arabinose efflux permease
MLLWSGQMASNVGSNAAGVVLPLLILSISQSPSAVGIAGALGIVPYLLLCLPVGALIDRWNRRHVMLWCELARGAVILTVPLAMWLGHITLWQLWLVAAVQGTLLVFYNISETASLPRVVAKVQLPAATAQNHAGYSAAGVVGPVLGTWTYCAIGRAVPFLLDALSYLVSAFTLWRLRSDFTPAPQSAPPHLRREIAEGIAWLWNERLVRTMAMLTAGCNFVNAALPLLLIMLARERGVNEAAIGLIFSLGGVGGVLGALVGPWVQRRFRFGQVIAGTLLVEAVTFPLLGWATGAWSLGLVFGVLMFIGPIYNVVQFSYRLGLIPDALQGRVNSSFRLVAHGLQPVGAVLCGVLIEHHGTPWALAMFGATYGGLWWAAWRLPSIQAAGRM